MEVTWRRIRGEPARAHALFDGYLGLGPTRSLPRLAATTGRSLSYLKKLSARWHWQARAAAWQQHVAISVQGGAGEDTTAQARDRQLKDARAMQQLARAQLARWIRRDPDGSTWLAKQLTPNQVVSFWKTGFSLERDLLPPSTEEEPRIDQHPKETAADREEKRPLSVGEALTRLAQALRSAGLRGEQVYRELTRVCRWLWLPEEEVEAVRHTRPGKANKKRKRRRHES